MGSIIGLNIAHHYPQYIEAYIGIGQIVHMKQNEELLYQHLIRSAKNIIIKSISVPFKIRKTAILDTRRLIIQRKWLGTFGGAIKTDLPFRSYEKAFSLNIRY